MFNKNRNSEFLCLAVIFNITSHLKMPNANLYVFCICCMAVLDLIPNSKVFVILSTFYVLPLYTIVCRENVVFDKVFEFELLVDILLVLSKSKKFFEFICVCLPVWPGSRPRDLSNRLILITIGLYHWCTTPWYLHSLIVLLN